jgi:hypothetical protein
VKTRAELLGLQAVMALCAVNLWTGGPLLALWVGSRAATSSRPTMGAVALVVATLAAVSLLLVRALNEASAAHDRLSGRVRTGHRQPPWLRSMRAERTDWERERAASLGALDRVLVAAVVAAVVAFEVWFFLFSGSSLPAA